MRSSPTIYQMLHVALIAITSFHFMACGGCNKKSSGKKGASTQVVPEPTETPEPTPTPEPDFVEDVGEETPPITTDKPITIDTDKKAAVRKLTFESSDKIWAGRHTTEYLIAIRSNEDSCVRIKMRPTDGLTTELDKENSGEQGSGRGACENLDQVIANGSAADESNDGGQGETGDGGEDQAQGQDGNDGGEGAALWSGLDFIRSDFASSSPLRLTDPDAALCTKRLFRMPILKKGDRVVNGLPEGLDDVVTKTGSLVLKGSHVRIWIDEEFSNVCSGGAGGLNDIPPVAFAPWIQQYVGDNGASILSAWINNQADQLRQEQIVALAADMDKIYNSMTSTFGAISDIDSSKYVEIFLTPEINRTNFSSVERIAPDEFQAQYMYRPQDLAYYNPELNPISNEGEILYLWTPDPAGIYNPNAHPSANSIASNYARGFLTSQLMNLVYINERLLKRDPAKPEDTWLIAGFSQLVSSYYAGIDFTKLPLAHYMTSRGQNLSLTDDSANKNEEKYIHTIDEVNGMRTMFMWYLHARICKTTAVKPCKTLKKLLTSDKTGKENIEKLLGGEDFKTTLANFGLAVGVSLTDNPETALETWKNLSDAEAKLMPLKPQILPDLGEVYVGNPHQMPEIELKPASGNPSIIELRDDITNADRTQAGPFPSKKMLMFQPITTDNEIEFATAKDSVSYVLVTGLVEGTTHATAVFGKGLNVTFIPIGDLDQTKRKIHFEKLSENALADLRPTNLTRHVPSDATEFTTYRYPPFYDPAAEEYDLSVTTSRDLWILGSIDNYEENIEGELVKIGDFDAYNISLNPCEGLTGAALTDCQSAGPYQLVAQVHVRDFLSELEPMLVTTDTDRKLFRGHSYVGRVTDVHPDFDPPKADERQHVFCTSNADQILGEVTFDTALNLVEMVDHGFANGTRVYFTTALVDTMAASWLPDGVGILTPYLVAAATADTFELTTTSGTPITMTDSPVGTDANTFYVHSAESADLAECANGLMPGNELYTDWVMQDYYSAYGERRGWAHNFVNYLAMGPRGFPYTNINTISYVDAPVRDTFREYYKFEASRQFLNFALTDLSEKIDHYKIWGTFSWAKLAPPKGAGFYGQGIAPFTTVHNFMKNCSANPDPDTDSGADVIGKCSGISDLDSSVCESLCTDKIDIANWIRAYNHSRNNYIICDRDLDCATELSVINFGINSIDAERIPPLLEPSSAMFINTVDADNDHFYYQTASVVENLMETSVSSYCEGETTSENQHGRCEIDLSAAPMAELTDIRQAFTAKAHRISTYGCRNSIIGEDLDVCIDGLSSHLEYKDNINVYYWLGETLATDRPLLRYANFVEVAGEVRGINYPQIYERAGEVLGKPLRVHHELLNVPGNQESIVNFIIGGRNLSQGKYLFRLRLQKARELLP